MNVTTRFAMHVMAVAMITSMINNAICAKAAETSRFAPSQNKALRACVLLRFSGWGFFFQKPDQNIGECVRVFDLGYMTAVADH